MTDADRDADLDDAPRCERCGEPRPEGPELCPPCEDLDRARFAPGPPPTTRRPPHGNTTR